MHTFVLAALLAVSADAAPLHHAELIFPLEHWHNHSSCIVEAPDGSLLTCWYTGSGERRSDDVRIVGSRRVKSAKGWSDRMELADTPGYPDCNCIFFIDGKNRLWLTWPTIIDHHWESALLKYRIASKWNAADDPPKWEQDGVIHITPKGFADDLLAEVNKIPETYFANPRSAGLVKQFKERAGQELYQRLGWMPRCHTTNLANGSIVLPLYCDTFSVSIMAITADDGQTWQTSRPLVGLGNIQPSVVQRKDGSLVAMMRENGPKDRIRICESKDNGMTWGPVTEMQFPNPGASVEVIKLQNGHWALVYNDAADGRYTLAVSISDDEGKTWKWTRHLEKTAPDVGRYHYPSMIQSRDGDLHCTYSFHVKEGKSIKYAHFNEAWVMQGDSPAVGGN